MSAAGVVGAVASVILVIGGVVGCAAYYPQYDIYVKESAGRAQLAEVESNRRIRVLEAQAALDAADLTSQAEVARSRGVAEANAIIADSLGGAEGYLRWRYIEMLENTSQGGRNVIYVPTEANLPILEAGQRQSLN
ncbi:MAG TPA: membrane protease subunit [Pelagibacterium sp.]|uniref:membrane protease subunit n=1 Tax=Pelagibacterium sp. TaxID=1967288 RepID=UPI002BB489F5|nr:membrane protease subunit [Pelagibacterium sp.]HWJ89055.1 membrane protease subunit [Pelagibacterium sp.]